MKPLFFKSQPIPKEWGGSTVNGEKIGEFILLDGLLSTVKGGDYADMPLCKLYEEYPDLFGLSTSEFPILIKIINAGSKLSLQIHGELSGVQTGQWEAWVVLRANMNAHLIMGTSFKTQEELASALSAEGIEHHLQYHFAEQGDVFFVPEGTVHAIGANIIMYEISGPKKNTKRLYDWGRPRPLNIDEGVKAYSAFDSEVKVKPKKIDDNRVLLLEREGVRLVRIDASTLVTEDCGDVFSVYTALDRGKIMYDGGETEYEFCDTFLIPANFGEFQFHGGTLIEATRIGDEIK